MTNLTNLFSQTATTQQGGANQLEKTAQLTSVSTDIAGTILTRVNADLEKYQELVAGSQTSHDIMDKLITESYDLTTVDIDFLITESDGNLEKMLRSQQSKRSRSKSKAMTMDNYKSMLTAAVAENLLRAAANKPKSAGGGTSRISDVTYSEEELQTLAADQEALKKAIRNVQSKKSIMKSKADFDETSDRWQQLLVAEEQLKSVRTGGVQTITVVDPQAQKAVETTQKVEEMLATAEVDSLKAADAKEMLKAIKEMLASK